MSITITNSYSPSEGPLVYGPLGSQKFTESLDAYSSVLLQIASSTSNSKHSIDSSWETGDIYYCNIDNGWVRKMSYSGTLKSSLHLTRPCAISVIQDHFEMPVNVSYPRPDDLGCWLTDLGTGNVIKTDASLNIVARSQGFTAPSIIASDYDQGCYVADNSSQTLTRLSSDAYVQYVFNYAGLSWTSISDIKTYRTSTENRLWVLADDLLYAFKYENGALLHWATLDPLEQFESSSTEVEEEHVGAIDVDRITGDLFVAGGDGSSGWIMKYDKSGNHNPSWEALYQDIVFPYVIKVVQGYESDSFYILADPNKWDEYGYGSSSSESSSSSSVSSSSSTSVSSSSSSS